MTSPTPSNANGVGNDRLNGWKEVALHFGKGVRTVQRWEKDLGLPIRRLGTGKGEIVFAFVAELERWRAAAEKREDLASKPGEEDTPDQREARPRYAGPDVQGSREAPGKAAFDERPAVADVAATTLAPSLRRGPSRPLLVAIPILVLLAAVAWWAFVRHPGEPYEARIENHALRVYDQDGGFLWEHRFEFPLVDDGEVSSARANQRSVLVADLDADGKREVVFVSNHEPMNVPGGVFVFEAEGTLRFRHQPRPRPVSFGDVPTPGPWHPIAVASAPDSGGTISIWLASIERDQFPTVVEKLDPTGRVLGEFWHAGNVTAMAAARYLGKDVMLLGAASNEHRGAALAVVGRLNPTGTGPALQGKYVCNGCPPSPPLEYLVFPGTDVERIQDNNAGVLRLDRAPGGELTVVVRHDLYLGRFGRGTSVLTGHTHYVLSADLRPLSAQHQPDFRVLHNEAYRLGILDHPFGPGDDANLTPVLRWNGREFEEVRPQGVNRPYSPAAPR